MSKEKAIDNIKEALKYTAKTALIETSPADKAVAVSWVEILLLRALKELNSKSLSLEIKKRRVNHLTHPSLLQQACTNPPSK